MTSPNRFNLSKNDRSVLCALVGVMLGSVVLLFRCGGQTLTNSTLADAAARDSVAARGAMGQKGFARGGKGGVRTAEAYYDDYGQGDLADLQGADDESFSVTMGQGSHALFPFDPNTASATQLRSLGLPPRLVRNILKFRASGGTFQRPATSPASTDSPRGSIVPCSPTSASATTTNRPPC